MAAGLPLVASDLPSLRELLTHERDALLVPADDAGALASALQRLLADPHLQKRLAAAFSARAPEHAWIARAPRLLAWMDEERSPTVQRNAASTARARFAYIDSNDTRRTAIFLRTSASSSTFRTAFGTFPASSRAASPPGNAPSKPASAR